MRKHILFVCMGNICRSAMAEGILLKKIETYRLPLSVDSAGTHGYHAGGEYDPRSKHELSRHGIVVNHLRSRRIVDSDFAQFDKIFAADTQNIKDLKNEFGHLAKKVELMSSYAKRHHNQNVPDPYYGDEKDFAAVYALLDEIIDDWLKADGYLKP